jgi:hypothetical protein
MRRPQYARPAPSLEQAEREPGVEDVTGPGRIAHLHREGVATDWFGIPRRQRERAPWTERHHPEARPASDQLAQPARR